MQRLGPTVEDCISRAKCFTPLWAETILGEATNVHPSMMQDDDFYRMMPVYDCPKDVRPHKYIPGTFSGLWEGTLMVSHLCFTVICKLSPLLNKIQTGEEFCTFPLQCDLTEHLCFAPNLPISMPIRYENDFSVDWSIRPRDLIKTPVRFPLFSQVIITLTRD
jgi:hypothetical protein